MEIKLQAVIDGIAHDLTGVKYISVDSEKERDITIESDEEGVAPRMISLTIAPRSTTMMHFRDIPQQ